MYTSTNNHLHDWCLFQIRYRLLPYLYTLFYHHHKDGNTVARSLWHEYPNDHIALGIDKQFLWGSGFMISPALHKDQTKVEAYFPSGIWYDYHTRSLASTTSGYITIECLLDCLPLHIKGGSIIPAQVCIYCSVINRQTDDFHS